jgi:Xaa-Pro aminopeptidase
MTISNEPGFYEDGLFGIRIENVCVTARASTENNFGSKQFCRFDTVTKVPISTKLVDLSLIDDVELSWLNDYNSSVRLALLKDIELQFPEAVPFLLKETETLKRTV